MTSIFLKAGRVSAVLKIRECSLAVLGPENGWEEAFSLTQCAPSLGHGFLSLLKNVAPPAAQSHSQVGSTMYTNYIMRLSHLWAKNFNLKSNHSTGNPAFPARLQKGESFIRDLVSFAGLIICDLDPALAADPTSLPFPASLWFFSHCCICGTVGDPTWGNEIVLKGSSLIAWDFRNYSYICTLSILYEKCKTRVNKWGCALLSRGLQCRHLPESVWVWIWAKIET